MDDLILKTPQYFILFWSEISIWLKCILIEGHIYFLDFWESVTIPFETVSGKKKESGCARGHGPLSPKAFEMMETHNHLLWWI